MTYTVEFSRRSLKFLKKLNNHDYKRIKSVIDQIKDDPFGQRGVTKLSGYDFTFRKRLGDIRIIYKVYRDRLLIVIEDMGYRGDIYKRY